MTHFLFFFILGLAAGIIDIVPMALKKLDAMFIWSALIMWVVVGVLLSQVQITNIYWLNGLILSLLVFLPLLFLIIRLDSSALPQICLTTVVLGSAMGYFSSFITGSDVL